MKIQRTHPARRDQDGMVSMIFVVLLSIMMILVTAESRALYLLHRDVKFLEQQQIKRLNSSPANTVATATTGTK